MTKEELKSNLAKSIKESNLSDSAINKIKRIVEWENIPFSVREAMEYVSSCEADMGFMGSPKYYEAKGIIESYKNNKS